MGHVPTLAQLLLPADARGRLAPGHLRDEERGQVDEDLAVAHLHNGVEWDEGLPFEDDAARHHHEAGGASIALDDLVDRSNCEMVGTEDLVPLLRDDLAASKAAKNSATSSTAIPIRG